MLQVHIRHNMKPAARNKEERRGRSQKRRGDEKSNIEPRLKFPLQLLVAHLLEMSMFMFMH